MRKVAVLLSTYNGKDFLSQQIESVLSQEGVYVHLYIRDDGSKDGTKEILNRLSKKENVTLIAGCNKGYTFSFLELMRFVVHENFDYYAFCDQDDFWQSKKLISAVKSIENNGNINEFCLYFSALTFVDESLREFGKKSYAKYRLTLPSAMTMSSAAGCTMVFTRSLLQTMVENIPTTLPNGIGHDGWVYRVCLAIGGTVIYDDTSRILFRRHNDNASNGGGGIVKKTEIALNLFKKNKNSQSQVAGIMLRKNLPLTKKSVQILRMAANYNESLSQRLRFLFNRDFNTGIGEIDFVKSLLVIVGAY